jgi:hypothetical protein
MGKMTRQRIGSITGKLEDVALAGAGLSYLGHVAMTEVPLFVPIAFLGTYAGTELVRRELLKRKLRKIV